MEIRAPLSSGWSPLPSNANVEITMVSVYPDSWEQREARSVHGNVGCRPMSQKVCSSHDWSSDLWIFVTFSTLGALPIITLPGSLEWKAC